MCSRSACPPPATPEPRPTRTSARPPLSGRPTAAESLVPNRPFPRPSHATRHFKLFGPTPKTVFQISIPPTPPTPAEVYTKTYAFPASVRKTHIFVYTSKTHCLHSTHIFVYTSNLDFSIPPQVPFPNVKTASISSQDPFPRTGPLQASGLVWVPRVQILRCIPFSP